MIDRKFTFVATNPCKGTIYTEKDAIVFCAKDAAVPAMLVAYQKKCKELGCESSHIESVGLLLGRVRDYQDKVGGRVPDTETDCEIDRCIGGNV